jgi:hypothetical protein
MVAITQGEAYLFVYYKKWGGFAPPMSKLRTWDDENEPGKIVEESPEDAAIRVAAEALGRPLREGETPVLHPKSPLYTSNEGNRDRRRKKYNIEFFTLAVGPDEVPKPLDGLPFAWLTLEDMMTHKPLTSTAQHIAYRLTQWKVG